MAPDSREEYVAALAGELSRMSRETEWVEFKVNYAEPTEIGEYISALANAAALFSKPFAYVVWGIADDNHKVVGTTFNPWSAKVGNENLENWLLRQLTPKLVFRFDQTTLDGKRLIVLELEAAFRHPVQFATQEFIRVGSYKKKLKDHPELERDLWRAFDRTPFEDGISAERVAEKDVLRLLDYPAYFELTDQPLPEGRQGILHALSEDGLIRRSRAGSWDVTNSGVLLFAKRLDEFPSLSRKAVRVIQYRGNNRNETLKEQLGVRGYASGFAGLMQYVVGVLPQNEVIEQALRRAVPMFPELAIRELVANALIHQDLAMKGSGPMIELFGDRLEITNPGAPLIDTQRFLDNPPRSRNEKLASLMRRMGVCEERGSGIDKVASQVEYYQLPAPIFEATTDATRAVLLAHRPLRRMNRTDRVRACYLHACLRFVNREYLTNTTVRQRFGIEDQNIAIASRIIREAVEAGALAPDNELAPPRYMRYVPWWAKPAASVGSQGARQGRARDARPKPDAD